ncbi:hypothetical protein Taro_051406 [Colocasia esculenta]|uniref:Transmembrane protein n=1 Tax=Colocasia esculenta TaxID=4460 RepID=A0A843XGW4_COLES|nr:hypothetical protein [Colocasia esculenta]
MDIDKFHYKVGWYRRRRIKSIKKLPSTNPAYNVDEALFDLSFNKNEEKLWELIQPFLKPIPASLFLTFLLPSARGSSSWELSVGRVAETAVALCVVSSSESECCELLYLSEQRVVFCKFSGCCCVACMASMVAQCVRVVVAQLVVDSLAVVFPLREPTCGKAFTGVGLLPVELVESALLLELSRCSVCRVASLVEHYDTCQWLLSAWCWLVAKVHHLAALCSSVVSQNRSEVCYCFGWCILAGLPRTFPWWFWWRFSQDQFASAVLLAVVFSLMVRVVWSFGLCILVKLGYVLMRFSQDGSWRFWWRCCALGRVSGCCIGQLVSLFVSKFVGCASGTSCVPMVRWFVSFFAPYVLSQMVVCFVLGVLRIFCECGVALVLAAHVASRLGCNSVLCRVFLVTE